MKQFILSCVLSVAAIAPSQAQQTTRQLPVYLDQTKPVEQRIDDAISRMTLAEKIRIIHAQSKFSSAGVPRLGFPDFWTDDGPHGVRPDVLWDEWEQAGQTNDSCVAFPALTCLAASWNPQMSRIYGEALGEEALYRGKDMILGPGVNIYRTPLNGRNFEYMGEDPFLASIMVVPYIQGLQSKGVSACVKHYCLNNDEEYRHQVNVIVSDRALHEIYLPAFKAAVEKGKTWGIMGAYNLYKNEHNCHNQWTLNKILKGDWKYDGVVVSDWGGAHDLEQSVKNGLDMEFGTWTDGLTMGATNAYDNYYLSMPYRKAIQEGKFTQKELDDKVRRVLRLFYRTTMNPNRPHGFLCSESHYATARQIAEEGIYVGYRWTDKERIKPTFAFGHGLSYTQFAISNLRSDKIQMKQDGTITFTVNVKNTGKRAGAETVQLYIHDVNASVDRPQKELKGFQKVYLQPGESKDISITINKEALSFYDEASSSWKAEAGKFEALVGNAADNLKLKKAFELF